MITNNTSQMGEVLVYVETHENKKFQISFQQLTSKGFVVLASQLVLQPPCTPDDDGRCRSCRGKVDLDRVGRRNPLQERR